MTSCLELFENRRSLAPHRMSGPGPTSVELERLLRIACRVPDHGKLEPWRFILFEGQGREKASSLIADFFKADNPDADGKQIEIEASRLTRAPVVVGVVSSLKNTTKIPEWEQCLSAGAVCMALTLAASTMGFVTAWLTEWYSYDRRVLDALGLDPHEQMAGFIHIGRRADPPEERKRPNLAEIVTVYS